MAEACDGFWREAEAAGVALRYCRCGEGKPVVILHHDIGCPERQAFAEALSASHDVLAPIHPGFGLGSERAEWMRSVRDLAALYRGWLADLGIARASLVGLGFGGWVAAEMASMAPADLDRLVLVGPMGLQPREGFILDQALVGYIDYAQAFFHDPAAFDAVWGREPSTDQLEAWDICREMCFRIAWKPYMYSQTLAPLLGAVRAPALIVRGAEDAVAPADCAEQYAAALPDARLETVADCGHAVALERPEALARLVADFIGE